MNIKPRIFLTFLIFALQVPVLPSNAIAAGADDIMQVQTGRPGQTRLKNKSSGVPAFDFYQAKGATKVKVQKIPLLDIGQESQLGFKSLLVATPPPVTTSGFVAKKNESKDLVLPKNLTSPDVIGKAQSVGPAITAPEIKPLAQLEAPELKASEVALTELIKMNDSDYKLLEALIFLDIHENYELSLGLLAELMKIKDYQNQIQFHYARTALGLKLDSEFRHYILKVAQESRNKTLKVQALQKAVENIEVINPSDIQQIDALINSTDLKVDQQSNYQLARAKYYLDQGDLTLANEALSLIDEKSKEYLPALLLTSIFEYRRGQVEKATEPLLKLLKLSESEKTSTLRGVAAITLARLQFQRSQFKEAYQSYLKVDKAHPLWLEAMTEQAWTQILVADYVGAAGNMFSLHTDFFKNAFSPESYVIRTVGYLNLCQYGDSVHALETMKRRYTPWKTKLESFLASKPVSEKYYDTIKMWLKNPKMSEVEGLPRSFIIELARHPSFLDLQTQINNAEDESVRYNEVSITLIRKEKEASEAQQQSLKNISALQKQMADKSVVPEKIKNEILQEEKKLASFKIQQQIAKTARTSIKDIRSTAIARLEKEKNQYKSEAGKSLQKRYADMLKDLNRILDQNEVLQYEIFSGAGEHIRYQMAGGGENDGYKVELTPDKHKSFQWKFKGEIWEDEVGHYRSSLKNVCPTDENQRGVAKSPADSKDKK